ncbi:sodium:neurotransmitter symporter [Catenovulum agarivorans DS-2]|uniref:Transporter n=1 Tax=Catenovulum agarivorans DS-2 TaxID=1328313 RepID=W7QQ08_9ALTE|nr:sodium-dependent transporter [Catenovulum agarivorans]EWH09988.1 sodium:neurotransmitter symporter [Catenovulum agarivorans DS-2]
MSDKQQSIHSQWSNKLTYILAATGAAVGLGNIWKFPYIMGENGGGAFVLVYLACIALVGIPIMIAEVYLGKKGRLSPMRSVAKVAQQNKASPLWQLAGGMGVLAGYLILSFYAVVAGWACAYIFKAVKGEFAGQDSQALQQTFANFISEPSSLLIWTSCILALTVFVVARGLQAGLEKATRFMMPAMLLLLIIIVAYSSLYGDMAATISFMFAPDFSKLTVESVLTALGHSFFSLSLASGIMIMYGAYLPEKTSIVKTSLWIACADTLVALLAGLAIFPIVFANGLEPGAGPGLIFVTLPLAFGQMPAGQLIGSVFFIMLVFAAFTSAIALIESSVAWLVEKCGFRRVQAAIVAGIGLWVLSLLSVYSFAPDTWATTDLFGESKSYFDVLDYFTSNILLPLGGLFIALFVGWKVNKSELASELNISQAIFQLLVLLLKVVTPIFIIAVFLNLIGVVQFS